MSANIDPLVKYKGSLPVDLEGQKDINDNEILDIVNPMIQIAGKD